MSRRQSFLCQVIPSHLLPLLLPSSRYFFSPSFKAQYKRHLLRGASWIRISQKGSLQNPHCSLLPSFPQCLLLQLFPSRGTPGIQGRWDNSSHLPWTWPTCRTFHIPPTAHQKARHAQHHFDNQKSTPRVSKHLPGKEGRTAPMTASASFGYPPSNNLGAKKSLN